MNSGNSPWFRANQYSRPHAEGYGFQHLTAFDQKVTGARCLESISVEVAYLTLTVREFSTNSVINVLSASKPGEAHPACCR